MKISALALASSLCMAAHSGVHTDIGLTIDKYLPSIVPKECLWAVEPLVLMKSHQVADAFVNEAYIGKDQIAVNIVMSAIQWLVTPDKDKARYTYCCFWSNLPDAIDKGLGVNVFHRDEPHFLIDQTYISVRVPI